MGVTSVTTTCSGTIPTVGTECTFHVTFAAPVVVGGSWHPRLNLATSPVPAIAYLCDDVDAVRTKPAYAQKCGGLGSGNGTATLNFGYTLWGGQSASPLVTSSSAIDLNGATIQDANGDDASLARANSVTFAGLVFSPGNAYCVSPGGNDNSSGLCGQASFATLTRAQSAAQGGSVRTIFLQNGTWGSGTATCTFTTNNGYLTNATAYICQTSADNGEVWAAYPGQTPVLDGGCPSSSGNSPNPGIPGCTFAAFESGFYDNGVTGTTRQGLTVQNFYGGGFYDYQPTNFTITDNTFQDLYNTCGNPNGGDSASCNGAGGCTYALNWWTNYDVSHNACLNVQGFGISTNSGEDGTPTGNNGYSMTLSYDLNIVNNSCTGVADCGAVYGGWYPGNNMAGYPIGTGQMTENLVSDTGPAFANGDEALYLDNNTSGFLVAGNIVTGTWTNAFLSNDGGANNLWTNNIADMTQFPSAPFYMPTGTLQQPGPALTQTNIDYTLNIIYSGVAPATWMGVISVNDGQPGTPDLGLNYYFAGAGAFSNAPYCWTNFGSPTGVCNPDGMLLSSNPFVNPGAQTAAGYQLQPGSTPLAGGFQQIGQNQGPR